MPSRRVAESNVENVGSGQIEAPGPEPDATRPQGESHALAHLRRAARSRWVLSPLVGLLFIAVWEIVSRATDVSKIVLPTPASIGSSLWADLVGGRTWTHIEATLVEIFAGFAVAAVAGIVGGLLLARSRTFEAAFYPYIVALQTMPKVAIAPLLVVWFGFGIESKVVVAALVAFFPLLVNVITGLKSVDRDLLDLMKMMRASRWQTFRRVELPASLPLVFAGLELAMVFAIIGAIVGEFVGAQRGLGYLILQRNFALDVPGMWSVLIILALVGTGLALLVRAVGRRATFWQRLGDKG